MLLGLVQWPEIDTKNLLLILNINGKEFSPVFYPRQILIKDHLCLPKCQFTKYQREGSTFSFSPPPFLRITGFSLILCFLFQLYCSLPLHGIYNTLHSPVAAKPGWQFVTEFPKTAPWRLLVLSKDLRQKETYPANLYLNQNQAKYRTEAFLQNLLFLQQAQLKY